MAHPLAVLGLAVLIAVPAAVLIRGSRTAKPRDHAAPRADVVEVDQHTMDRMIATAEAALAASAPRNGAATKPQLDQLLTSSRAMLRDTGARVSAELHGRWEHEVAAATSAAAGSDAGAIATAFTGLQQVTNDAAAQLFENGTPVKVR